MPLLDIVGSVGATAGEKTNQFQNSHIQKVNVCNPFEAGNKELSRITVSVFEDDRELWQAKLKDITSTNVGGNKVLKNRFQ